MSLRILVGALAAAIVAAAPAGDEVALGPARLVLNHVEVAPGAPEGDPGRGPLGVRFLPADWPNATLKPSAPWDWSKYKRLLIDLENPGAEAVAFGLRVDDDAAADGTVHCRTAESTLGPGESATFAVTLGPGAAAYGMRGLPGQAGTRTLSTTGTGPFDLHHIVAFQVYLHRPPQPRTLVLRRARLAPTPTLEGIVDAFGQYTGGDWPGKVHDAAELGRRRVAELADLKAHPRMSDRDRFGGWEAGPKQRASGSFRTERLDGKWWLIDPDGRLFFSSGMDEIRPDFPTVITGRESMFSWLPREGDPLTAYLGTTGVVHSGPVKKGRTFDFYRANVARKYGDRPLRAWRLTTLRRLPSWGFNTFGNWSDGFHGNGEVPYVASATILGNHARVTSGSDYWAKMHDPFDPRFAVSVERSLSQLAASVRRDPWCLGYFIDNELSWGDGDSADPRGHYGLALGTLAESARLPAKVEMIARLRQKRGDIARLNAAWTTKFASWQALDDPWTPDGPLTPALQADLADFTRHFAARYFQVVRDRLRQLDARHLYLGCRFASFTPEAVAAAAEYCDVVSFNIYARRIDAAKWKFLNDLNRPCLIGEYHAGALDRGMFHPGLVATPDQAARAEVFADYVGSVLDHPAFVGCHWFEYVDEPLTGRTFDGENYAIGFVSVTDTPYPEMVEAARSVHRTMYRRRFGGAIVPPNAPAP